MFHKGPPFLTKVESLCLALVLAVVISFFISWLPNQALALYMVAVPDSSQWPQFVFKIGPFTQVSLILSSKKWFDLRQFSGICQLNADNQSSYLCLCSARFARDSLQNFSKHFQGTVPDWSGFRPIKIENQKKQISSLKSNRDTVTTATTKDTVLENSNLLNRNWFFTGMICMTSFLTSHKFGMLFENAWFESQWLWWYSVNYSNLPE